MKRKKYKKCQKNGLQNWTWEDCRERMRYMSPRTKVSLSNLGKCSGHVFENVSRKCFVENWHFRWHFFAFFDNYWHFHFNQWLKSVYYYFIFWTHLSQTLWASITLHMWILGIIFGSREGAQGAPSGPGGQGGPSWPWAESRIECQELTENAID